VPVGGLVMVYMAVISAVMIGSRSCKYGAITRQKAPPSPWCSAVTVAGEDDRSLSILYA